MIVIDEAMRLNVLQTICQAGSADLLPEGHRARVIFGHQKTHYQKQAERLERERNMRSKIADRSLIPDEVPTVPNRQPKMAFR
jgi:hypothetical protein